MVDFIRRSTTKRHVRALAVVPSRQRMELAQKQSAPEWHQCQPRDALFERQDQSLDYRDTPVLTHSPKAWPDSTTLAPLLVTCTWPELLALVADEMSRWPAGLENCPGEKASDRDRIWFAVEGSKAHDPS